MQNKLYVIIMLTISLFLVGCGQDIVFDNTPDSNDTNGSTKAPVVNAGKDITTPVFKAVEIVGTVTVGDGQIVGYEWRENLQLISGRKSFTYTPSTEGNHTLTFSAFDDNDLKGSDSIIVTVTPEVNGSI